MIAAYVAETPSGHTSVDGPTEIVDLEKTEANKQLIRSLIDDILIGEAPDKIGDYISHETYIQHNAETPDGLQHFEPLATLPDRALIYQEIILLVGQGNFVATLCKATWEGKPYAQVDIFRIEDGLVVEHWDNAEPVPPKQEWANSGKF